MVFKAKGKVGELEKKLMKMFYALLLQHDEYSKDWKGERVIDFPLLAKRLGIRREKLHRMLKDGSYGLSIEDAGKLTDVLMISLVLHGKDTLCFDGSSAELGAIIKRHNARMPILSPDSKRIDRQDFQFSKWYEENQSQSQIFWKMLSGVSRKMRDNPEVKGLVDSLQEQFKSSGERLQAIGETYQKIKSVYEAEAKAKATKKPAKKKKPTR